MPNNFLEQFYENIILPRYSELEGFTDIHWIDHGQVGSDAWAHYFELGGKQYALLYEDFPDGSPFSDDMSHELVKCGDLPSIELTFSDSPTLLANITGWYTLYKELSR